MPPSHAGLAIQRLISREPVDFHTVLYLRPPLRVIP